MKHERHAEPATPSWAIRKLRQYWPVLPLACILFALMLSDLDVMGYSPLRSDPCGLQEIDQSTISGKLYGPLAQRALRASSAATPSVAIVTIDANTEPPGLLTNTCDSRTFLARLVDDLNLLGARVIVIDKDYSPTSCADSAKTGNFIARLLASRAPIVVGQATHALANTSAGCLALSPRLEFTAASSTAPAAQNKVRYGLTRLNSDTLKIPLRWPLFTEPASSLAPGIQPAMSLPAASTGSPAQVPDVTQGDGLALAAAHAYDPAILQSPRLQQLLAAWRHPYTTFPGLPSVNAMTALCNAEPAHTYATAASSGAPDLCSPWVFTSTAQQDQLKNLIAGKVVVIGDLSEQDVHPFPGKDQPGVYLQANYVQAILDQRFLQEIPLPLTLAFLILFVIGVYCLYWSHDLHGEPHLTPEQAGLASLGVLLLLAVISIAVLLRFRYFTPVWALWGAAVFMIFRYLEASGHHRSQHLRAQLAGERHRPASQKHQTHSSHTPPEEDKP